MLIGACLEVLGIGIIPVFIGIIAFPENLQNNNYLNKYFEIGMIDQKHLLIYSSIVLMAFFLIKNMYFVFNYYLNARIIKNRQIALSQRLFNAYIHASYSYFLDKNSSEMMRNIQAETNIIGEKVISPILNILMRSTILFGILVLLTMKEPLITLLGIGALGVSGILISVFFNKGIIKYNQREQQGRKKLIKLIRESIGCIKEIKILNREKFFSDRFANISNTVALSMRYRYYISKIGHPSMETAAISVLLAITIFLAFNDYSIEYIVTTLTLFAVGLTRIKQSLAEIVNNYMELKYNHISVQPVYADLIYLENKKINNKSIPLLFSTDRPSKNILNIKNVSFKYPFSEKEVLSNIHLSIEQGSSVGIIGTTGSGKTTLVDLILGLISPIKGEIVIDFNPQFNNQAEWRSKIGYIPQSIYLIDDTIKNNVALGIPHGEINIDKVNEALSSAMLTEYVDQLPEGINTKIGERGIKISGGQKQRIGIARVLYNNPALLVMDEATSALDTLTEKRIQSTIERLKGRMTIITIAHRISTVKNYDKLVYLENGQVKYIGNYDELIRISPEFREMAI
jgi:ATP-binding cassette subfamily C protein